MVKLLALSLCALLWLSSSAPAGVPKRHAEFMKDEDYKSAFEQFTAVMGEVEERFTADEYKAVEQQNEEAIAASVKEDLETGNAEIEAYATAYWMRSEQLDTELVWDWLRKNPEDAQGFYRLKSGVFDGYLTLEKGDEDGENTEYAVKISAIMKEEPRHMGYFEGLGRLGAGGAMSVSDGEEQVIEIRLDGDSAKLSESRAFKESGALGDGVTFDGEYLRERK